MLKKSFPLQLINLFIVVVIYLILMSLIQFGIINNYYRDIIISILIYIILAVSLNLTTGFLGQLALGHAGFMAIGAYTSALITKTMELPTAVEFPVAILLGGICSAVIGILIGIPALRLKGDYLAIITLGFGEIIRNIVQNIKITGGTKGLHSIPSYSNINIIYWIMVLTVFIIFNLINSRHGRAIVSIREDEIAAEASGINTTFYKLFAFSLAAFFAGVAGSLFAHQMTMLVPKTFNFNYSIEMIIMVVLGGMGSITGSVASAIFLTALPQFLSSLSNYRMLIYSILLIVIMIFKPSGILGKREFSVKNIIEKLNKNKVKSKRGV